MPSKRFLALAVLLCAAVGQAGAALAIPELPVRFHRLMLEDGLSQSSIVSIYQDSRGFIWMGTQDGLNRYDGSRIVISKTDPDRKHSLSDPNITCITEDKDGNLWLGTEGGGFNHYLRDWELFFAYRNNPVQTDDHHSLDVRDIEVDSDDTVWLATLHDGLMHFDPESEELVPFGHDAANQALLGSTSALSLAWGEQNQLWVGTAAGLSLVDTESGTAMNFRHDPADPTSLIAGEVQTLVPGSHGSVWIGTTEGLASYDPESGEFKRHELSPAREDALAALSVKAILEEANGHLWIGTEHNGLYHLEPESGVCRHYVNDPQDEASLSDNEVMSLMMDQTGVIWVGTSNGANRLDSKAKQFYHVYNQQGSQASLTNDCVWSLWEDRSGTVWTVTEDGLNLYDTETGQVKQVIADPDDPHAPSYNSFVETYEDARGGIWLAARDGALNRYDPDTGIYERFAPDPDTPGGLATDKIFAIEEDPDGLVWMGSMNGLEIYDPATGNFNSLRNDPDDRFSLPQGSIRALFFDSLGRLWVSAWGNGVSYRDPQTGEFHHFRHRPNDTNSLSGNVALCIYQDTKERIWVGTSSGLNLVNPETGKCLWFTERDGLPNNTVYGIQEDPSGKLWFGTNYGLVRFDPGSGLIQSYTAREGIQDNEFNMGAYHTGRSGMMYFGGIKGFSAFYPDSIQHNPYVPVVRLTDFRIFNKPVRIGPDDDGDTILAKSITEADHIDLSYKDNVISFEFSVLHYASPEKNKFAYKLDGFEDEWNEVGTRNHATYTNLPPGSYVFRVRGANNDGVWNQEGTSITIKVHPPFYRQAWFIALFVMLLGSAIYGAHWYRMRLLDVKNKVLERRVAERTEEMALANAHLQQEVTVRKRVEGELRDAKNTAEAATRAKSDFLANMSHEIRTPMNGVLGMTAILLDTELSNDQREYSEMIYASANNLLVVINDILDFSKIEAGKLELETIEFDICEVVDGVADVLALKANENSLHFSSVIKPGVPRMLRGDPGRLRQVITNLANNAVKFTTEGEVQVAISLERRQGTWAELRFEVRDSGVGIPADRLDRIFDSFTQVDASVTRQYGGTGLGLAIVKQLIGLMDGQVGVDSIEGEGATFWFTVGFQTQAGPTAIRGGKPVLVAHQNAATRSVVCRQLEFLGYRAVDVDPESAFAPGHGDLPPSPLAVLVGSDGDRDSVVAMTRLARQCISAPACPAILLCELGCPIEQENLQEMGLDGYLTLPVHHGRLEAALEVLDATVAPALTSAPAGASAVSATREEAAKLPLLLLAEDNPINQRVATLLLHKIGYRVDVAANGLDVLKAVAEKPYAAILMDVQMPLMDGLEATRRIRATDSPALDPEVPIIALTAHAMNDDRRRSLAAGMNDHVSKPMDSEAVAAVLKVLIKEPQPVSS